MRGGQEYLRDPLKILRDLPKLSEILRDPPKPFGDPIWTFWTLSTPILECLECLYNLDKGLIHSSGYYIKPETPDQPGTPDYSPANFRFSLERCCLQYAKDWVETTPSSRLGEG